jgi:CRP-like cAMP-binding protein
MSESLKLHIKRYIDITDEEFLDVMAFLKPLDFRKKQNLFKEGEICQSNYFVVKGCLRLFFVNEKGTEQTTQFALENWWIADYFSFSNRTPSAFFVQAVEASSVLAIDFAAQEKMLNDHPVMEKYFRSIHQRAHAASQTRIKYMYSMSREELYHQFNSLYPEFVQRIPQYLLASYLNFTPEYLSEIRSKRIS